MFLLTAPILHYAVITDPFPLRASAESGNANKAKLTALATNGTGSDVVLEGIIVQLPVGDGANSLTLDPAVIGPIVPSHWTLASTQTPSGFVQYVFQPKDGFATLPKGQSLVFAFNNIEVNRTPGTFAVQITEGSGNCVPPDCPTYTTHLTKFPNAWGQVAFGAKPTNIPYQASTVLLWSGPQGATYTIDYMANGNVIRIPQQGQPPFANQGQYPGVPDPPLTLDATTVFTLNVSQRIDNEEFHAQQQVTVSVGPPPAPKPKIQKFHGSVALDGSQLQLTLSWITEIADQITLTHVNGFQKPSDTLIIRPTTRDPLANTYTLEARKGQEAVTSTISIVWVGSKSVPVVFSPQDCAILPDGSRLFATGGFANSVTVLDPLTLAKVPGSPFSLARERTNPQGIAASPDSTRVYVGSIYPKNRLWGYDSRTFKAVSGSPAETGGAYHMAVTPDNQSIYVSGDFDVQVFATSNMKLLRSIRVGNTPQGIAFTPDSSRAFVTIGGDAEVCVIDHASGNKIGTLKVGARPISAAVTPDGKQLYVGNQGSSSVSVFDPATLQQLPGSPIGVRGGPLRLAPSRDGKRMFVLCLRWGQRLNVIDTSTRTLVGATDIGSHPTGLAVSPDGVRVYVLLRSSNQMWMLLPTATGGTG